MPAEQAMLNQTFTHEPLSYGTRQLEALEEFCIAYEFSFHVPSSLSNWKHFVNKVVSRYDLVSIRHC